jgi:hypothetical protein
MDQYVTLNVTYFVQYVYLFLPKKGYVRYQTVLLVFGLLYCTMYLHMLKIASSKTGVKLQVSHLTLRGVRTYVLKYVERALPKARQLLISKKLQEA